MEISIGKKDVFWNYIAVSLSLLANVIILPFIVRYLNPDTLGLWYIFQSIGGITVVFDFGFNATFARNIAYCWSGASSLNDDKMIHTDNNQRDYYLMKKILTTCKVVYLFLSLSVLTLMLTVGTAYVLFVSKNIAGIWHIVAWLLFSLAVFLNLYYGYFSSFLRGVGAIEKVSKATIIAKSMQIFATILLLISGMEIVGACTAYLMYGIAFRTLSKKYFYEHDNIGDKLAAITKKPNSKEIKELFVIVWEKAWKEGIVSVSIYLNTQASTLICSYFLSLSQTGIYSLSVQLANVVGTISSALYTAYQPSLQKAYVKNDMEDTRNKMSLIVTSFVMLFVVGTILMAVVGVWIIKYIKPSADISRAVYLGISAYQFLTLYRNCFLSYFSCSNRLIYYKSMLLTSILSIIVSATLIKYTNLGVWGLILGQIGCQLLFNSWYWSLRAHKEMQINSFQMVGRFRNELKSMLTNRV